jgi:putative transposase
MLVFEFKAYANENQFNAVGKAIRTAQLIRNSCLHYWMNKKSGWYSLNKYCAILVAHDFRFASELYSKARQSSA